MSTPVVLVHEGPGLGFVEEGRDVLWVRDEYTLPRTFDFDCDVCGEPITDDRLWTCMDGGEAAHFYGTCVTVREAEL